MKATVFSSTKEITKELIWRNFLAVRVNFSFLHTSVIGTVKRSTVCVGKWRIYSRERSPHQRKISSNQLFNNFFSKTVTFKNFTVFSHCECVLWIYIFFSFNHRKTFIYSSGSISFGWHLHVPGMQHKQRIRKRICEYDVWLHSMQSWDELLWGWHWILRQDIKKNWTNSKIASKREGLLFRKWECFVS